VKNISKTWLGVLVLLSVVAILAIIYNKAYLGTKATGIFTSTSTIEAEFTQNYKLIAYEAGSDVKTAGVVIGRITGVDRTDRGTYRVTMQVKGDLRDKLGSAPTATIRATLLLGGRYYIDLEPGGNPGKFTDDVIPVQRTMLPVELYDVVDSAAGTPAAWQGIRSSIDQYDGVLQKDGANAVRDLVQHAPATLEPGKEVLMGLRGTQPGTDWTQAVEGLRNTAAGLTSHAGQIESIITSVDKSTAALAASAGPVSSFAATLPDTMRTTRAGLDDLRPTLDHLADVSDDFRPSARSLSRAVRALDPALHKARPVLHDLKDVLRDARPLVDRLSPLSRRASDVFDDVNGRALDGVNGPLMRALYAKWNGTGPYAGSGNTNIPLFKEIGYLSSRAGSVFAWHDQRSAYARVSAGGGSETLGALFRPFPQQMHKLGLPGPLGQAAPGADQGKPGPLGDRQPENPYNKPLAQLPVPNAPHTPTNPLLSPFNPQGGDR
jgi:phospholipid/cholesterol/gamma-HCH transport system substrate-binding protein